MPKFNNMPQGGVPHDNGAPPFYGVPPLMENSLPCQTMMRIIRILHPLLTTLPLKPLIHGENLTLKRLFNVWTPSKSLMEQIGCLSNSNSNGLVEFLYGLPHGHTIPIDPIAFQEYCRYSTTVFNGIYMRTLMSLQFELRQFIGQNMPAIRVALSHI